MKKISVILALLMVLTTFSALTVSAGPVYVVPIDDIHMPLATPTIDGVINADEGWSKASPFDFDHTAPMWAHNAMTNAGSFNFAYSAEGIYYAFDITEIDHYYTPNQNGDPSDYDGNGFVYSTGEDTLNTTNTYGWDGDVISFMIDPGSAILNAGYVGNNDYTPWYHIGLFEDGTARMYRTRVNDGEITDQVQVAGVAKEAKAGSFTDPYGTVSEGTLTGWTVEAFIPWSVIAQDCSDIIFGETTYTPEQLAAEGFTFKAAFMYMDRFNDPDSGLVDSWGRWITVCERTPDGIPGNASSGDVVKALGLTLKNGAELENPFTDIPEVSWYTDACLWCYSKGYMTGLDKDLFGPSNKLTRAQFVQILAKVAGADLSKVEYKNVFSDVPAGKWYTNAVLWAVDFGVTGGVGNGMFGTSNNVTRQQLASFLRTFAEKSGKDVSNTTDITGYTDYAQVAGWARTPLAWAVSESLISSTSSTVKTLNPNGLASRAQVAVIIKAFCTFLGK